jgi:hypothetical protein
MGSATVERSSIHRLAGRVGGYARAAKHDGRAMTAAARQRFIDSFLEGHGCRVCPAAELPADHDALPRAHLGQRQNDAHRRHELAGRCLPVSGAVWVVEKGPAGMATQTMNRALRSSGRRTAITSGDVPEDESTTTGAHLVDRVL